MTSEDQRLAEEYVKKTMVEDASPLMKAFSRKDFIAGRESLRGEMALSAKQLERVAALSKRVEFLRSRIVEAEASGRDLSFDKAEMSALSWAVDRLTSKESK